MALSQAGCGLAVPDIQEPWQSPDTTQRMVVGIVCRVRHDLKTELQELVNSPVGADYLKKWGVQVALTLTVEEKSSLVPGVIFNNPLASAITTFPGTASVPPTKAFTPNTVASPQNFSLGVGGTLSADADRIDIVSFYYSVKELLDDHDDYKQCETYPAASGSSLLVDSEDLKIKEWIETATQLSGVTGGVKYPEYATGPAKQDVIQHHVKFEIVSSGNITPIWKLVRISANQGSPFFNVSRDRTHDLLITLGPTEKPTGAPSTPASNAHLAAQIGIQVSENIRILFQQ
jgi:hypothetical protein